MMDNDLWLPMVRILRRTIAAMILLGAWQALFVPALPQ